MNSTILLQDQFVSKDKNWELKLKPKVSPQHDRCKNVISQFADKTLLMALRMNMWAVGQEIISNCLRLNSNLKSCSTMFLGSFICKMGEILILNNNGNTKWSLPKTDVRIQGDDAWKTFIVQCLVLIKWSPQRKCFINVSFYRCYYNRSPHPDGRTRGHWETEKREGWKPK